MQKSILTLVLFFAAIVLVIAQANEIEFTEYDLDNGMHVILHQDNSTPIVAVSIMYHVGSKNEDPERTGFAHFFEHLLFEGSKNIKRGEFDKYITNAGGVNNANTSNDRTYYYEILPSNQLELGLWLESERLLHANIDEVGVETQREVVKEEKRQRVDNRPYGSILEEISKRAYKEHPYRWTTIGSMDHLNAASLDEFMDFYKTFYVPENATLSIAGDIDIKETRELIDKYFADIPRGGNEIPRPDIVEPEQKEEIRDVVYDKIQLPAVIQAYHMPAQGTDDYYALNMLSTLLSGGQSSRMYKKLVDEDQKALQVLAIPFGSEDPGLYLTFGLANMGVSLEDLEEGMDEEIEKVQNELITEKEFQKIRNQVENNIVSGNSTVTGIAENLANYHVYFGDANLINTEIEKYMDVTREDIKNVANKYLNRNNRVVLYYLPESAKNKPEELKLKTDN
ncbi:insulinase family protein [Fulvivirga sp. RKSG066]|uniref:M16 family metallopeptidase n=1 Tax=Fulvivirga aurantia TaxID=2529383 RepID=UPI0012BB5A5B|nr:pitrilysin family protein [Fulvivirga aurantia]MTI21450.1 insulinase family protein [Fulvivirga aurantia]